jgi:hypothetical protein
MSYRVGATRIGCLVGAVLFALLPAAAHAAWNQPVGGASPINQVPTGGAENATLASVGGVPFVAFEESDTTNTELRVARLETGGTDWAQPWQGVSDTSGGINQSTTLEAADPEIADVGGVPFVAWTEVDATAPPNANTEIRIARLTPGSPASWQQSWNTVPAVSNTAGGINFSQTENATNPSIAEIAGTAWVAWVETDISGNEEAHAARLTPGNDWVEPAANLAANYGGINADTTRDALEVSIAEVGGVPFVAWAETNGGAEQLRVSFFNTSTNLWEQRVPGAVLNQDSTRSAIDPSITSIGGVPYVAWREFDGTNDEIRVKRLNGAGTAWEDVTAGVTATSGAVNESTTRPAAEPTIASIGGVPYLAWREADGTNDEARVARLDFGTGAWTQIVGGPSPINQSSTTSAGVPDLASVGGIPWVSWVESAQARATRLEPEFTARSATPTQSGATLSTTVNTFGLPYPVGFEHGAALENETPLQTTPAGAQTATVTQEVTGLSPSSTFQFRPFAEAGTPRPRVLGTTGQFTTLTAPPNPEPTPQADSEGPDLVLSGKRKQELAKSVKVKATCKDEPCALEGTGKLVVAKGRSKRALKAFALRPAGAEAGQGEPKTLKLKLGRKPRTAAGRGLDANGRVKAKLSVIATDDAGNDTTAKRKLKLVG